MPDPKRSEIKHRPVRIGLLGATFDTGNMGVNALAESAIKCILHQWPDADITLLDSGRVVGEHRLRIGGKDICIRKMPVRFCKNIFLSNHFLVLCLYALLFKMFRWEEFKRFCARRNASLRSITQMDLVADITGGDSFSDIYGMRRFTLGFLRKWLVLLFNKDLIMLPQTYGPFKRCSSRTMARHILKRASLVYSRDRAGVGEVNKLLNNTENRKVRFAPDVAFVLDSRKPKQLDIEPSTNIRAQDSIVVGLNISGLLYNGGYNRNNMFALKVDYQKLIYDIIDLFMKHDSVRLLLVPHVFSPQGTVESDPDACLAVYEKLKQKYSGRLFLAKGEYDQNEIKYIIGMCDFFIGSRMHSCIAAMSQCIPSVGVAYSKKFYGVFESIELSNCVTDAKNSNEIQVLEKVRSIFENKEEIRKHLQKTVPLVKNKVLEIFTT